METTLGTPTTSAPLAPGSKRYTLHHVFKGIVIALLIGIGFAVGFGAESYLDSKENEILNNGGNIEILPEDNSETMGENVIPDSNGDEPCEKLETFSNAEFPSFSFQYDSCEWLMEDIQSITFEDSEMGDVEQTLVGVTNGSYTLYFNLIDAQNEPPIDEPQCIETERTELPNGPVRIKKEGLDVTMLAEVLDPEDNYSSVAQFFYGQYSPATTPAPGFTGICLDQPFYYLTTNASGESVYLNVYIVGELSSDLLAQTADEVVETMVF